MNTLMTRSTNSFWLPYRHYTDIPKFMILYTKDAQVSLMCFIILNDLYTAHHSLLGTCHQLTIRHLYGTFNFSTQCICMGTGSLFVYDFHCFRGKACPLGRKTIFAVASIEFKPGKSHTHTQKHNFDEEIEVKAMTIDKTQRMPCLFNLTCFFLYPNFFLSQFEQENQRLFNEMNCLVDEVR